MLCRFVIWSEVIRYSSSEVRWYVFLAKFECPVLYLAVLQCKSEIQSLCCDRESGVDTTTLDIPVRYLSRVCQDTCAVYIVWVAFEVQ